MPDFKFSNPNRFAKGRKDKIKIILDTIKQNKNIHVEELSAKLKVNPPYLSDSFITGILLSLNKDGQIKINQKGIVELCHK